MLGGITEKLMLHEMSYRHNKQGSEYGNDFNSSLGNMSQGHGKIGI